MKAIKWLDKNFELLVLALMLALMSVLSFANVIMRYCFKSAFSWSDEVCCYCLALSAFFALPCAIRMGSSIRVDTFIHMFPEKVRKVLNLVTNVIMIVFLGFTLGGVMEITANAAKVNQASPALRIPMASLYTIMGFAIALAIFRYVEVTIFELKGKKVGEE